MLKNVVALSQKESNNVEQNQRRNSIYPLSKGVKRVYVHDLRKDQTYGGIHDAPGNNFKIFKHTEPPNVMSPTLRSVKTMLPNHQTSGQLAP